MAARKRPKVLAALAEGFDNARVAVGISKIFQWGPYSELKREQAVRLSSLSSEPLKDLILAMAKSLGATAVSSVKPTEWRDAAHTFLKAHPEANYSKKFLAPDFARYLAKQLVVVFAHMRRLLQNATKKSNALGVMDASSITGAEHFLERFQTLWPVHAAAPAAHGKGRKHLRRAAHPQQQQQQQAAHPSGSSLAANLTGSAVAANLSGSAVAASTSAMAANPEGSAVATSTSAMAASTPAMAASTSAKSSQKKKKKKKKKKRSGKEKSVPEVTSKALAATPAEDTSLAATPEVTSELTSLAATPAEVTSELTSLAATPAEVTSELTSLAAAASDVTSRSSQQHQESVGSCSFRCPFKIKQAASGVIGSCSFRCHFKIKQAASGVIGSWSNNIKETSSEARGIQFL